MSCSANKLKLPYQKKAHQECPALQSCSSEDFYSRMSHHFHMLHLVIYHSLHTHDNCYQLITCYPTNRSCKDKEILIFSIWEIQNLNLIYGLCRLRERQAQTLTSWPVMQMFEEILLPWKFFIEQDFFQSDWSKTGENMQIKCKFHGNQKP